MKYVRVFAEPTDDNPGAPSFYVDAIVDDTGEILGKHTLFGVQGRFERRDEHFEPFVLDSRGQIDWGDGFDKAANDRFGTLDLRDGPVTMGRLLHLRTDNYGTHCYRIRDINELPVRT
jgi:hypothetical protein